MLLTISNLQVSYGPIAALRGVSLEIEQGQIVTLIGANGAGKTTLLRTISGLIPPTAGAITWRGTDGIEADLARLRPDRIVGLGISHVPEGRQIFANLTVKENLLLGGYQQPHHALSTDIRRVYELFPVLHERRRQRSGTLSGGEQQMLAIGRALMARPRLLLLDEPSLGLAPMVVRKIFQIIRQINAAGTTVFLIEQNAHMALAVANRAYVLQTGQIILADSAANLLQNPEVKRAYLGG
ncbi:MAG: ABC transporter ATP-binding protein [Tepidisphaeraceae bacterium]